MDKDKITEMISKSLDEIDTLVDNISKSDLSKALGENEPVPNEVSEDAPEDTEEDEQQPQEEGQEEQEQPEQDEEDTDTDTDTEAEEDAEGEEDVEKSLEGELKSNDSVRKALEVSEFLDTLVKSISGRMEVTSKAVSEHNEQLVKSLQSNHESNELLAKSLMGIVKSQKVLLEQNTELAKSVRSLTKQVKDLQSQPVARKSVSGVQPLNKSFESSMGTTPQPQTQQLSKSQVSQKLLEAVENNKIEASELLAYEGTGNVNALSASARGYLGL